jgi:phosphoribosylformylglycinamidine synthase
MIHVLKNVMGQDVAVLWHKDKDLQGLGEGDCIVLPGGFSYGDYLRAGAIARFSPIMESVIEFANNGGYVIGICNGFQILCESGLLPGALVRNQDQKFICKNVYIRTETSDSALTNRSERNQVLKIPVAHAEGRFLADSKTLDSLAANDQVLFRYCGPTGDLSEEFNPNGSLDNIAGICNESRNVFGMMPHPERAAEEDLKNTDGRILFESMLAEVTA